MRISDSTINNVMLQSINGNGAQLGKLMQQISSGERITTISDDPFSAAKINYLNSRAQTLDLYMSNANAVKNELSLYEMRLGNVENDLQRMNELMIWGSNGAISESEREGIVVEMRSLKENIITSFNARNEEGSYIFSGTKNSTPALQVNKAITGGYEFHGNDEIRQTFVGEDKLVSSSVTLNSVTQIKTLLGSIDILISEFSQSDLDIDKVESAMNVIRASHADVSASISSIGSQMNNIERSLSNNTDLKVFNETLEQELNTLDVAQAASQLNALMTSLDASYKTFSQINTLGLFTRL